MAKRIAIVEDDPDQRNNYVDAITKKGYDVTAYSNRREAIAGFENELPELAILDIILGDEVDAGFEICRDLLSRSPNLPVIFLTERIAEIDKISGLRLGAWDYLPKPISLDYLAERISSLLRINEARGQSAVRVPGHAVSYDTLMNATMQSLVTNNTINTHMRNIRKKFEHIDKDFDCIKSEYGFGYRWSVKQ